MLSFFFCLSFSFVLFLAPPAPRANLSAREQRGIQNQLREQLQAHLRELYSDLFQIPPFEEGAEYTEEDLKRVGKFREDEIELFERWDFSGYDFSARAGEVRFVIRGQTRIGNQVSTTRRPFVRGETWPFAWRYACELLGQKIEFCRALESAVD